MFRRLIFEDSAAVFTLVAFITAVSIFVSISWRALRMKRSQLAHSEQLPFSTPTPAARHDTDAIASRRDPPSPLV